MGAGGVATSASGPSRGAAGFSAATAEGGVKITRVTWARPVPAEVWRAIEAYLAIAYDGAPPAAVAERLATLRAAGEAAFYDCGAFEHGEGRCALRLGNRFYPHMKLVVTSAPDGRPLFRADTHDRHVLEMVGSADERLAEMMARNAEIARGIETAWSGCGILCSREHLREQMESWRAARQ